LPRASPQGMLSGRCWTAAARPSATTSEQQGRAGMVEWTEQQGGRKGGRQRQLLGSRGRKRPQPGLFCLRHCSGLLVAEFSVAVITSQEQWCIAAVAVCMSSQHAALLLCHGL
jgi:hypothetical protein